VIEENTTMVGEEVAGLEPVPRTDSVVAAYSDKLFTQQNYEFSTEKARHRYAESQKSKQQIDNASKDEQINFNNFGIPDDVSTRKDYRNISDEGDTVSATEEPDKGLLMKAWNAAPDWAQKIAYPFLTPFLKGTEEENPILRGVVSGVVQGFNNTLEFARDINNAMPKTKKFNEDEWLQIPKILESNPDKATEGVVNGLSQFISVYSGLGVMSKAKELKNAPKKMKILDDMWRGAIADAMFDPEEGNLATLINMLDEDKTVAGLPVGKLHGPFTEWLGTPVGEDAEAYERLQQRAKNLLEGAGIGFAVHTLMHMFKGTKDWMLDSDPDQFWKVLKQLGISDQRIFAFQNTQGGNVIPFKKITSKDFKRNKDGTYVGFNKTINTPQKLNKMIADIEGLAKEAEKGRYWYENSSKAILKVTGGDVKEAEILAQIIAVTSQSTGVKTNTGFALKAYSQWKAGLPINTGRFPVEQSKKIEDILNGIPWEGRKTNSFYRNLMVHIDPKVAADLPTTQDMWMARAFGLDSDSPTSAQYENMEKITKNLAEKLGWKPHQVQASVWVAMKGRFDPVKASITKHAKSKGWLDSSGEVLPKYEKKYSKYFNEQVFGKEFNEEQMLKAAYDYANGIQDNLGNIALEAIPSVTSGVLRGIHTAAPEAQAAFTKDMYEIFLEDGVDQLAKEIGILSPDNFSGFGGWQGTVNESIQLRTVMSGTNKVGKINSADRQLMEIYASVIGRVFKQDGVSYRRAFEPKNLDEANGVLIELGDLRPLTKVETERLYKALEEEFGHSWVSPIPSYKGVEIINFPEKDGSFKIDNKTFKKKVKNAIIEADLPDATTGSFKSDGNLLENDWEVYPNGQGYGQSFTERSSDLYNRLVSKYDKKAEEIRQRYANEYGWDKAEGSTSSSTVGEPTATAVDTTKSKELEAKKVLPKGGNT
jgi:hypothetical protein